MSTIRLQQCLAEGDFGEVYRGVLSRDDGEDHDVVVRLLPATLHLQDPDVLRIRHEARLLLHVTHPAIPRLHDLVEIDGRAALITAYVSGASLPALIASEPLSGRTVFETIAQVAAALDAAWTWPSMTDGKPLHVLHGGVRPRAIRIDRSGSARLTGLGLVSARRAVADSDVTGAQYLAPERLVQQELGPEADVYALGCTLFEALTGEALFQGRSMRQMYLLMVEPAEFKAVVSERCDAARASLGSDRGIALLRAMTAHRKTDRPTAAQVAARCDVISDSIPGPTLLQWSRQRTWLPAPAEDRSKESAIEATSLLGTAPEQVPAQPIAVAPYSFTPSPLSARAATPEPSFPPPPPPFAPPSQVRTHGDFGATPLGTDLVERASKTLSRDGPMPWSGAEMAALYVDEPSDESPVQAHAAHESAPVAAAAEPQEETDPDIQITELAAAQPVTPDQETEIAAPGQAVLVSPPLPTPPEHPAPLELTAEEAIDVVELSEPEPTPPPARPTSRKKRNSTFARRAGVAAASSLAALFVVIVFGLLLTLVVYTMAG